MSSSGINTPQPFTAFIGAEVMIEGVRGELFGWTYFSGECMAMVAVNGSLSSHTYIYCFPFSIVSKYIVQNFASEDSSKKPSQ